MRDERGVWLSDEFPSNRRRDPRATLDCAPGPRLGENSPWRVRKRTVLAAACRFGAGVLDRSGIPPIIPSRFRAGFGPTFSAIAGFFRGATVASAGRAALPARDESEQRNSPFWPSGYPFPPERETGVETPSVEQTQPRFSWSRTAGRLRPPSPRATMRRITTVGVFRTGVRR